MKTMHRFAFLLLMPAALLWAGCGDIIYIIEPLGDTDLEEQQEGENDDGDDTPADGDQTGDIEGDFDIDGEPAAGIYLTFTNGGDQATYVPFYDGNITGHLGVTIMDANNRTLMMDSGCTPACGEMCERIMCEPYFSQRVKQVLPGETIDFYWDGYAYTQEVCGSDDYGDISCSRRTRMADGQYYARVCHWPLLGVNLDQPPVRERGDTIIWATQQNDDNCDIFAITLEPGVHSVRKTITPALESPKEPGYCGRYWETVNPGYAMFSHASYQGREGVSLPVTVERPLGGVPFPCLGFSGMGFTVNSGDRLVTLTLAMRSSSGVCDDFAQPGFYTYFLPPLDVGPWTLLIDPGTDAVAETATLVVVENGAYPCTAEPFSALGETCMVDCQCTTENAVCDLDYSHCVATCATSDQCPRSYTCSGGGLADSGYPTTCLPLGEPQCVRDTDCPTDQYCATGVGSPRCLPSHDQRGLSWGVGIECGCDAECPPGQACLRMNAGSGGACVIPCRDIRECPTDHYCSGVTETVPGICQPWGYDRR